MKKRCALCPLGLLLGLALMASLGLTACAPAPTPTPTRAVTLTPTREPSVTIIATPSAVASTTVSLSQVLERWDAQRVAIDSPLDEIAEYWLEEGKRSSSSIPYALAGQQFMVGGDMRAAIEAFNAAIAIDPQADAPHFLLGDVIYRLAFFDMVDRGLCSIKLTPVKEIPQAVLSHGHLRIEILELVGPGRSAAYGEFLASQGVDEPTQLKVSIYLLWVFQPTDVSEVMLQDVGGPPEMLPVPECEPDDRSKHFLRMAYKEISLAEQGTPLEMPGVMIVDKDRMANIAVRIQVLLGNEIAPIFQPTLVSTSALPPPTSVPWADVIRRISERVDEQVYKDRIEELWIGDYGALQKEQQEACTTGNLMQCYIVGYEFLQLAQLGYFDAYADAINTFNLILSKNPEFGRAHYGLGRAYYVLALTDLGFRDQMQTTESGLSIPVLDEQGADLFQRALDEFEIAFALDLELANDSDAQAFIEMTKDKLVSYWIKQGYEMETGGNPAAAVEYYEKALRLDPESYVANFNKGNALFDLSQFQEAIEAYDEALIVRPNSAEAINNREIAKLWAADIQWPDGLQALEFLESDLESSDRKIQLGAVLLLFWECQEENQEACDVLGRAVQQNPTLLDDLEELEISER